MIDMILEVEEIVLVANPIDIKDMSISVRMLRLAMINYRKEERLILGNF